MAQRRGVIRKIDPVRSIGFDQRRWPLLLALSVLAGVAVAMILAVSAMDDPRPLHNGWFRLAMLGLAMACLCTFIFLFDRQLTRRSQLALIVSVIGHVLLSGVLYHQFLDLPVLRVADQTTPDPEEKPAVVPQYHVRPADQRPLAEAFEQPEPAQTPDVPPVKTTRHEAKARPAETHQQASTLPETQPAIEPTDIELQRPVPAASHRAPDVSQLARQIAPATAPWTDVPQLDHEVGELTAETLSPQTVSTARRDATVKVPTAPALETQLTIDHDTVAIAQTARVARSELPSVAADRSAQQTPPVARVTAAAMLAEARIAVDAPTPLAQSELAEPRAVAVAMAAPAIRTPTPPRAEPTATSAAHALTDRDTSLPTTAVAVEPHDLPAGRVGRRDASMARQLATGGAALQRAAIPAAGVSGEAEMETTGDAPSQASRAAQASPTAAGNLATTPASIAAAARRAARAAQSTPASSATVDASTAVTVLLPRHRGQTTGLRAEGTGGRIARREPALRRAPAAAADAVHEADRGTTETASGPIAATRSDDASPSDQIFRADAGGQRVGPVASQSNTSRRTDAAETGPGPPATLSDMGSLLAAASGTSAVAVPSIRFAQRHAAAAATPAAQIAGSPHRKTTTASLPGQIVGNVPGIVTLSQYAEVSSPAAETSAGRLGRGRGTLLVPAAAELGIGGLAAEPSPQTGLPHRKARRESEIVHHRPDKYPQRKFGGPAAASGRARDVAAAFVRRGERQRTVNDGGNGRPLPKTEAAIELGLAFLARQQFPDGHWSFRSAEEGRGNTSGSGAIQADTAATGLCLLAFLGAGYDHYDDQYQQVVRRGLSYLVDHQQPNGALYGDHEREVDRVAQMYSHGIATIAVNEAVGMTGDLALRPTAQQAIDFIVAAQHPVRGGWRYEPQHSSDLSVTGWQLMALKSGELAGMHVPGAAYRNVVTFLDRCRGKGAQRGLFVYNPYALDTPEQRHGRQPSTVMTSIGLLMRLYTGRDRTDPDIQRGAAHLLENLPRIAAPAPTGSLGNPMRDTYYWYHATQVMYHMRGRYWSAWHNALHSALLDTQLKTGRRAGSWDSRRPVPDRWGYQGGDLLMTAMNLLSLEVAYRHLPIYENTLDRPSKLATADR